jgi:hypothetical protein
MPLVRVTSRAEKLERLRELCEKRVEARLPDALDREFVQLRADLLDDASLAPFLPTLLKDCRSLSEVYGVIRQQPAGWEVRRQYVRSDFKAVLDYVDSQRRLPTPKFASSTDDFVSRVVQVLISRDRRDEVALLVGGHVALQLSNVEEYETVGWDLRIGIPLKLHDALKESERAAFQDAILDVGRDLAKNTPGNDEDWLAAVLLYADVKPIAEWQTDALAFVRGEGITNQGRARSTNIAPLEHEGLLFRSRAEIAVYVALKKQGVPFAPLPVFLRGGATFQRVEPDFFVFEGKAVMVIEVDGDTVHTESPAEADRRTRIFKDEHAFIERVLASEVDTPAKADTRVKEILARFRAWRG